jgi:elongation factor P
MATTSDIKVGSTIRFNGELYSIFEWQHRTPGNLRAFYQAKLKNMKSGKMIENRFRSGEEVDLVRVERKKLQYLYRDANSFVFMDQETYDQLHVDEDYIGEGAKFLKESEFVEILFSGTEIIFVELPIFVNLVVTESEPGIKGDTATGATKAAKLETGAIVNVPLFICEGDMLKIDTRTGAYMERVKTS